MKIADVLKSLVEYGRFSEWFGLSNGFSLRKVADRAFLYGCTDKFWSKEALETIITPFREYATKQGLTEEVIDKELDYLSKKLVVEINLLRRVYYQVEAEPESEFLDLEEKTETE